MKTQQTPLGLLRWEDPCWVSDPIPAPIFGGAPIAIQIFPEGDDEAAVDDERVEVLERFFALPPQRALEIVPHLWLYYLQVRAAIDDVVQIAGPTQVWAHVHPKFVSAERDGHGAIYASIEGECDWEVEHGIQLVLLNGERWVRVSDFSGHLTDGRAYARPLLDTWINDPNATLPVRTFEQMLSLRTK